MHAKWLSNIKPVKKKNGKIRRCINFWNLNKACPKDEFPLPNMDMLIDLDGGHAMFSFMDGFSGYNHIRMSSKDIAKTAFRTPFVNKDVWKLLNYRHIKQVHSLLSTRQWSSRSYQPSAIKNSQQDGAWIWGWLDRTLARNSVGMPKLKQNSHQTITILSCIWYRGYTSSWAIGSHSKGCSWIRNRYGCYHLCKN